MLHHTHLPEPSQDGDGMLFEYVPASHGLQVRVGDRPWDVL